MISVSVLTTPEELIALRDEWNALLVRLDINDIIFLRCEWFITWWNCFGDERDLKIILVREDNNDLVAIFPFMAEIDKVLWKRVHKLKAIGNDHTYFYDVITPQESSVRDDIYEALFVYLKHEKWDSIEMPNILQTSSTVEALKKIAKRNKLMLHLSEPLHKNPYILINSTFKDCLQSLSKKFIKELNRGERKLKDIGDVSFEEIQRGDVSNSILEEAYNIEFQSWKGKNGTAISCNENTQRFYTEFAKVAAQNGWLRLYFLKVNDIRIAFMYNVRYRGIECSMKIGYKNEYSTCSPGNILQKYNLGAVFRDKLKQYEFMGRFTEQKKKWTPNGKIAIGVYLYNNSLLSHFIYFIQFGFKSYVKRFTVIVRMKNVITRLLKQSKTRHFKT